MSTAKDIRIGLVGARGYVGAELIRLFDAHPRFALAYVSSRELAGRHVSVQHPEFRGDLVYEALSHEDIAARAVDAVVLALPNGKAPELVDAIDAARAMRGNDPVVVDLSADHRFDDAWHYGLPELTRARAEGARRIANPGCYATAMQLALAPLCDVLDGPAQCFGVSGWSGAGTTPSERNDPDKLRDNLMPYALVGHLHEREVTRQLAHPVEFLPHVAPHFRGLTVTVNAHLAAPHTLEALRERYAHHYRREPLVRVIDDAPWVSRIADRHHAEIGGLALSADGRRLAVVATLDNLLKGAATQAVQNLNLAFGLPELAGIPVEDGA